MHFEHWGINVPDAKSAADWYVANCGMRIVVQSEGSPWMRFLADSTGRIVVELYSNDAAPIPDYANQSPLVVHFAFAVDDAQAEKERLVAAGATVVSEGAQLIMLRDPWGLALQLCQRDQPFSLPGA